VFPEQEGSAAMALNVKQVNRLIEPGRYCDGKGLYLVVGEGEGKSWLLRYQRAGRERWMGLGSFSEFNLEEARERARKARQQLRDNIDPLEARKAERDAAAKEAAKRLTFAEATQQYYDSHEKGRLIWTVTARLLSAKERAATEDTGQKKQMELLSVVKAHEGASVTITEPSDRQRRMAVHAKAKAMVANWTRGRPAMLRDMERRRRAAEEQELFELQQLRELQQLQSAWPQYNSWKGERW